MVELTLGLSQLGVSKMTASLCEFIVQQSSLPSLPTPDIQYSTHLHMYGFANELPMAVAVDGVNNIKFDMRFLRSSNPVLSSMREYIKNVSGIGMNDIQVLLGGSGVGNKQLSHCYYHSFTVQLQIVVVCDFFCMCFSFCCCIR